MRGKSGKKTNLGLKMAASFVAMNPGFVEPVVAPPPPPARLNGAQKRNERSLFCQTKFFFNT